MFVVFVSYDAEDRQWAGELKREIEGIGPAEVFLAHDDIRSGALWRDEIKSRLQSVEILVVLVSEKSIKSQWLRHEFGAGDIRDIPILLLSIDGTIPESSDPLSARQYKRVQSWSEAAGHVWECIHSNFPQDPRRISFLIDGLKGSGSFDGTRSVVAKCAQPSIPLPKASWHQVIDSIKAHNGNGQASHARIQVNRNWISCGNWLLSYFEQSGFKVRSQNIDGGRIYVCPHCNVIELSEQGEHAFLRGVRSRDGSTLAASGQLGLTSQQK